MSVTHSYWTSVFPRTFMYQKAVYKACSLEEAKLISLLPFNHLGFFFFWMFIVRILANYLSLAACSL
jgi:hypothetical protein